MPVGEEQYLLLGSYRASTVTPNYEFFALKADSGDHRYWDRKYGGADEDKCHAAVKGIDGRIILAGNSRSFGGQDKDIYLIAIDTAGQVIDQTLIKDEVDTGVRDIFATSDDRYLLVGSRRDSARAGTAAFVIKTEL